MAPRNQPKNASTEAFDPDELFENYAPSAIPVPGGTSADVIIGEFVAVTRGPEKVFGGKKTWSFVVEFSAIAGTTLDMKTGDITPLVVGEHYSLWLYAQTLADDFIKARPAVGEKFAVKSYGRKLKKDMEDIPENYYNHVSAAFPDREKEVKTASWDDK